MSTAVQSTSAPDKESMKTDHSRAVADGAHSHAGPEPAALLKQLVAEGKRFQDL